MAEKVLFLFFAVCVCVCVCVCVILGLPYSHLKTLASVAMCPTNLKHCSAGSCLHKS
ncbi:hypothetical protein Peur_010948 [Populus x canadensis]